MNLPYTGMLVADTIEKEINYAKDPNLHLMGFLDPNQKYLSLKQFNDKCSEFENFLGHPDIPFENMSTPVYIKQTC